MNLKKQFMHLSTSPANYLITFAKKKNNEQKLCIDYQKFNDITIKNQYFLPSI